LGNFFRRRFGAEAFDYLIEPLVAGIYAGDADELSMEATFPRFKELEQQHGSVIKGMRAAQSNAKAGMAPKSSSLSSSLFMTLRNGLGELIETLTQRLIEQGVQLQTGSECRNVQASPEGDRAMTMILDNDTTLTTDVVVLATPAFQTAKIIRELLPEAASILEGIPYTSTATISMVYPTEAVERHIRGFGFVVPRKEQRALLAGTWTSLKWPFRTQKGETLIRCYVGGRGREHILENDDSQLVNSVRKELQAIVGIMGSPTYTEVHRWVRGMPQYVIGHQARVAKIQECLVPWSKLHISGAGLYGIGIPDCIREGKRVADRLIQSFLATSTTAAS
jgi:oxygen-dependent protoporphyrinogen oxidase